MDINTKELLVQLADTAFEGDIEVSVKKKYKHKYKPFRMFGMDQSSMSLFKALLLVENSKWRVRALNALLIYFDSRRATSTLPDSLYAAPSEKLQFTAALKYLCNNNIAIKLTKTNCKNNKITYQKRTWMLNPNIVYIPDAHEVDCVTWKQITNNEP